MLGARRVRSLVPPVASRVASRGFFGSMFDSKPVGSSEGWKFALAEVAFDKAAEAKLPVPESEFFLPVPSKMTAMAERGFTEYAFVTWASMGDGATLAPAGSFCFKGLDVAPIWSALALTEPHPMGKQMGIPESAAALTFGGYKNLSVQAKSFDDFLTKDPSVPGVAELQTAIKGGVSDFRVNPPFPPFDKYKRFTWVGGSYALDFAGIAGAFVYELPDDGGLVYHAGTLVH